MEPTTGMTQTHDDARTAAPTGAGGLLWTMRFLALAGLALAAFLTAVSLGLLPGDDLPGCGVSQWTDCESVLNDARYSRWFNLPVSALALGLYAVVVAALFSTRRRAARLTPIAHWLLAAAAVCIPVAAVWFIYIQLAVLGNICPYCMAEHAVGLVLTGLIFAYLARSEAKQVLPWSAGFIGLAMAAALVGAQIFASPSHLRRARGGLDEQGRYVEQVDHGRPVTLLEGDVQLNPRQHLMLGDPHAQRIIVEVIDFACPHCRELHDVLAEARGTMGLDASVLVLTFPLNDECNDYAGPPGRRFMDSCYLAQLAHAVSMTDPDQYEGFHNWLLEHQDELTRDAALAEAERRVDPQQLESYLSDDDQAPRRVRQDAYIAHRLGASRLPRLMVGDYVVAPIPGDAAKLAEQIERAFE